MERGISDQKPSGTDFNGSSPIFSRHQLDQATKQLFSAFHKKLDVTENDSASDGFERFDTLTQDMKLYFMSFLSMPTLASFSRLNKSWNKLFQKSSLWQTLCKREFRLLTLEYANRTFNSWKQMFMELSVPLEFDPNYQLSSYGYLGEQKAEQKLKSKPVGTFLFRNSNTDPNAITISFVGNDKNIRHRRMHRLPQGLGYSFQQPGYKREVTETDICKNYTRLLLNNSWMVYPLISGTLDSVKHFFEDDKIDVHCPDNQGPPSSASINLIAQNLSMNSEAVAAATQLLIRSNVYYGYKIGYSDLDKLIRALEQNTTITSLTIKHMHINNLVGTGLANTLLKNNTISEVKFHHCSCDDGPLQAIVASINANLCIQTITLNNNTWSRQTLPTMTKSDFNRFQCLPWECARN